MMIRPAAVSGMFYPSHPVQLEQTVSTLLHDATAHPQEGLLGLVVPHAGYEYSGATAAAAYAAIPKQQFSTVVILGPSHREFFNGISVYPGDAYSTPLGMLEVNTSLRARLIAQSTLIIPSVQGHRDEHAIEVQLPFLRHQLPDATILPVVVGNQSPEYIRTLGAALAEVIDVASTLVIASSDLSHFHTLKDAEQLDAVARDAISHLDPDDLLHQLEEGKAEACGGGPVASLLYAALAHGATGCTILHQTTSAEVTRETRRVVGYLSAAIYKN
jgi:MEMO1 family protein